MNKNTNKLLRLFCSPGYEKIAISVMGSKSLLRGAHIPKPKITPTAPPGPQVMNGGSIRNEAKNVRRFDPSLGFFGRLREAVPTKYKMLGLGAASLAGGAIGTTALMSGGRQASIADPNTSMIRRGLKLNTGYFRPQDLKVYQNNGVAY